MAQLDDLYAALKNADAAGDTASAQKLAAYIQTQTAQPVAATAAPEPGLMDRISSGAQNLTLGAVRGAAGIGATVMAPLDYLARKAGVDPNGMVGSIIGRDDRREQLTPALQTLGADPDSIAFKTGKLGGEIAGTAGAGGILAKGAQGLRAAPEIVNALATNGFSLGNASRLSGAGALALRSGAGALAGGAQVGLASPEDAGAGLLFGGALPGVMQGAGIVGAIGNDAAQAGARRLMQSALKPTIKQLKNGDAKVAVQTLLDEGINPTAGGVEQLKGRIGDLNDQIGNALSASNATIDPQQVANALSRSTGKFGNQVSPTNDLAAIDGIKNDFLANAGAGDIPVQLAQQLKQGTYGVLKGKYGELGSASTEAQKDLARGLKEQIAQAVPEVAPLNAQESRLLATLSLADRRALMDANKNPVSLDAALALATGHPAAAAALLSNSTAWTKAMAARGLNSASTGNALQLNALTGPALFRAIPSASRK